MKTYADPEDFAGKRIGSTVGGKWTLVELIGAGGAAWVYRAFGPSGKEAAVKVLHQSLIDTSVRSRFAREAKIANAIKHPGVVHVIDDGTIEERVPYIVMEFLEGETLQDRADRKGGTLSVEEVMWSAIEVLSILHAAHKVGVVHRDVKPENIFLTHERKIRLLDFGIARLLAEKRSGHGTAVGTVLGTLEFMPPEQARGDVDKVGIKTDLWAVGATIFTLLTGKFVHDESEIADQFIAVRSKPAPPIVSVAPQIPESIAMVVDLALRFDAGDRWANAKAMQTALIVANAAANESEEVPTSTQLNILLPPEAPPVSLRRPPRQN